MFKSNYSKWKDVYCYDRAGAYYLLQMKINLKTNKKKFRRARMGSINDYAQKETIYENALKYKVD